MTFYIRRIHTHIYRKKNDNEYSRIRNMNQYERGKPSTYTQSNVTTSSNNNKPKKYFTYFVARSHERNIFFFFFGVSHLLVSIDCDEGIVKLKKKLNLTIAI